MKDEYLTVAKEARSVYRDRGSRFIGIVFPVESETDIKEMLNTLRKEFHDARHHCYAYRLDPEGSVWRVNDDGEPAGSAGKPMLGQLQSSGVSDVLAVVIRYFGGTKLGVPGLIKAYKTSIKDALSEAGTVSKIVLKPLVIDYGFEHMNQVMKVIKEMNPQVISAHYDAMCRMEIRIRKSEAERLRSKLEPIKGVQILERFCEASVEAERRIL